MGGERNAVSALCWVPRGRSAAFPESYILKEQRIEDAQKLSGNLKLSTSLKAKNEFERLAKSKEHAGSDAEGSENDGDSGNWEEMSQDEEQPVFGCIEKDGAATLKDPYLKVSEKDEADDDEENIILPTDLVFVAASANAEFSTLEVYVHDQDRGSLYVHHEILCGGYPLSLEWVGVSPDSGNRNLIACGSFEKSISIFDLDVLDRLDPVLELGISTQISAGKKPSKKNTALEFSHKGPVMALHKAPNKPEILASGSADESVRLWDLSAAKGLHVYEHHKGKVQALRWHPVEPSVIASASYDESVAVFDVRTPDAVMRAKISSEAETCLWLRHDPAKCVVTSEDGFMECFDIRKLEAQSIASANSRASKGCVWGVHAHKGPASGLADSIIPGLLVSCGTDNLARIWNVNDMIGSNGSTPAPTCLLFRDLKAGPLFSCQSCEDEKSIFCFGGHEAVVWDLHDTPELTDILSQ